MEKYKLKPGKLAGSVVGAYKKVETAFTDAFLEPAENAGGLPALKTGKIGKIVAARYRNMEDRVVNGYKKVEDAFVDAFLEKVDATDGIPRDPGAGKE